jgi:hypothetical protein
MFAFLKLIPARFFIYAAIAAAFAFVLMREKWAVDKAKLLSAENTQLVATLSAERENTRKANEASAKYQADLAQLRTDRSDNPLPAVVCKRARVPAASTAPAGLDAARPADDPPEDAGDRDIGPLLDDYATACEANLIQLTRLQEWVRSR